MINNWILSVLLLGSVVLEVQAAGSALEVLGQAHLAKRWHQGLVIKRRSKAGAFVPCSFQYAHSG
jgi:hypothetical protein